MEFSPSSSPVPSLLDKKIMVHWRYAPRPVDIQVAPILTKLRSTDQPSTCIEPDIEALETSDYLKESLLESQKIEIVRKENFFSEEVTEEERDIIAKRVALQQKQFAEFERRDRLRKSAKIRAIFDYVNDEEVQEMLLDCDEQEDEVIYRLTNSQYLIQIRKAIATKYAHHDIAKIGTMNTDQEIAYKQLLKKRSSTLKKTTRDHLKKLALDDALKQAQEHHVDPEKAFEGWSQARIRAYQMIDENPNSYYYRFNAPGEEQRKGQWTEDEKKVFFERLREVGANGQWGIFSMKVPGRVGYQCSNFYRLLVETKKIKDPNYVLDERGKAHYLFDKKHADGQIRKTFRTHNKQNNSGESTPTPTASEPCPSTQRGKGKGVAGSTDIESSSNTKESRATSATTRRRRRRGRWGDSSASDSDEDASNYDDDDSGIYATRATQAEEKESDSQRRSKRRRRPTLAAVEAGLVAKPQCAWDMHLKGGSSDNNENHDEGSDGETDDENETNGTNPLPEFIDPITLDEVVKPAISKYGHVMGYDSWVRCLTSWEGKRNICPLTKKPLTKRDLVILDFENIDEYRDKIVNL
ncbi:uncharacterized protein BYT42DRAFT_614312 [Radiomyces spectabilis]|uniref:uncharacterized protein n=1 Tax=Radiomyces spectabilis TaxID=64574 RepID=UPI00221E60A4|nr:uncharacterized protein BYT42DRAFT_614312 [Radiomyces spectabilis]KAI8377647.1 hypothetical protein BYT42DRAFT_614312 [Radiomyces spectabilis]